MELLNRRIKVTRGENQKTMHGSVIDGVRLSLRWADDDNPNRDVVINFTREETKRIKNILK